MTSDTAPAPVNGLATLEDVVRVLREIRDDQAVMLPSSTPADSDYVWSYRAPATSMFTAGPLDWTDPSYEVHRAQLHPVSIDVPYDTKRPYVIIEPSARSVELVDDVTGLTVLAAGPGQGVSGCVGEFSSLRAIIGPGLEATNITVRFSTRPLDINGGGVRASGVLPLVPRATYGAGAASVQAFGWFRNPTGAKTLAVNYRTYGTDPAATIGTSVFYPKLSGDVRGSGPVTALVGVGAGAGIAGFTARGILAIVSVTTPILGLEFGLLVSVNNTPLGVEFDISYELIH